MDREETRLSRRWWGHSLVMGWIVALSLLGSDLALATESAIKESKRLVYLASDRRIPFWEIMWRGVRSAAEARGYHVELLSADNDPRRELEWTVQTLKQQVDGLIVSPTTSSACATILKLAQRAGVPVVISDIGTDGGEYVSYISSDNREGAYQIGFLLGERLLRLGWNTGSVGIIAIPQKRFNGQARTAGFLDALSQFGIKGADIRQQVDFSDQETYDYSVELLRAHRDLRALWLQGSDRYGAALRAIRDEGRTGEVVLITFDAEPEFLDLIPRQVLAGAAMQQPYLMGRKAVEMMDRHLRGEKVEQEVRLSVLAISPENITERLPEIKRNVLGIEEG